ncbi:lytic transglycosylase domain-containing protein [Roseivivax sp. CAU 1753]
MSLVKFSALCVALTLAAPLDAVAQSETGMSARFVKPPKPGTSKRITVQIAPRANPAVLPPPETGTADPEMPQDVVAVTPAKPGGRYGWFWQKIAASTAEASGPGRLEPALAALKAAPEAARVSAPRMQVLQDIAASHGSSLLRHSVGTRVSPALALAVMAVESGGKVDAVSRVGAEGLMQLMPDTARKLGVADSFDPDQNIRGGIVFLDALMVAYRGDPVLVLAGYNAGQTAVAEAGGVPDFAETRDYVPKVLAAFEIARGLCKTPPMMISDGCVFIVSP